MTSHRHRALMGELEKATVIPRTPAAQGGALSLSRALWRVAAARVTGGNSVRLLVDGPETFGYMLELINNAETSVDLEQYYWHDDEVGCDFCEALEAAAKRGVRVRVLVDWFGSAFKAIKRLRGVTEAGGEVRIFNPPGFRRWLGALPRDHRKLLVVDDKVGVTGGIGIAEQWGKWRPARRAVAPWRDTGVAIGGPAARDLERGFLVMWHLAAGRRLTREERRARMMSSGAKVDARHEPPALVGIVEGLPGRTRVARALQLAAVSADKSIWLASAYFIPGYREVEALLGAARDGVDVRVLVPNQNDQQWVTLLSRRYYKVLLRGGVRIWEWDGVMMHAKMSVTDGRVTRIGSTDVNPMGVAINYELDAFIEDAALGAAAEAQYLRDLDRSTEVRLLNGRIRRGSVEISPASK
jgi:cardiolipin synthase